MRMQSMCLGLSLNALGLMVTACGNVDSSDMASHRMHLKHRYLVEISSASDRRFIDLAFQNYTVQYRYEHVFNGYAMELNGAELSEVRATSAVKNIYEPREFKPHAVQEKAPWQVDWADFTDKRKDGKYAYNATGRDVTAYMIDSGIFTGHPEFQGRARVGRDFTTEVGTDLENQDGFGHGTHVAGLVGSATYGLAKEVELVAVKVFNHRGDTADTPTMLAAMDWVIEDQKAQGKRGVVNMSLGGDADDVMDAAVRKLVESGFPVIVSAGNDNSNACSFSPSREPVAITVTAVQSMGLKPPFANFGKCVDLIAPGDGIRSTWKNGRTDVWGGTSQSAPQATGAAAIYLQLHPEASPKEVHDFLVANSTEKGMGLFPNNTPHHLLNLAWNIPAK